MTKVIENKVKDPIIYVALNLLTNKVIAKGKDGKKVIEKANESGEEYILDFVTNPNYSFIF